MNDVIRTSNELRTALQLLVHRASEELGAFHSLVTLAEAILEMVPAHETREVPALDDETRWILGRPNFWCGPIAHVFQAAGVEIEKKAEAEQAFVIHWLLNLYLKHGAETYRAEAQRELNVAKEAAA